MKRELWTLDIENTGVMNRIAQKLFHKPSHTRSSGCDRQFCIPLLDGKKNIIELGELVKEQFWGRGEPLLSETGEFSDFRQLSFSGNGSKMG